MKVKTKTDTETGEAIEALLTHFAERHNPGSDVQMFYHLENIRKAAHYARKRVYLSATNNIKMEFEHNTIYSLYIIFLQTDQGRIAFNQSHVLVQLYFTQLFETARKKAERAMNITKAQKQIAA